MCVNKNSQLKKAKKKKKIISDWIFKNKDTEISPVTDSFDTSPE